MAVGVRKGKSCDLLLIDDLFLRRLPAGAGDELADVLMSRYEKASTIITSNHVVEDWPKLLGDVVVVDPLLDRLMHHGQLLKFDGKSWRLKEAAARVVRKTAQSYNAPRPVASRVGDFDPATGGGI